MGFQRFLPVTDDFWKGKNFALGSVKPVWILKDAIHMVERFKKGDKNVDSLITFRYLFTVLPVLSNISICWVPSCDQHLFCVLLWAPSQPLSGSFKTTDGMCHWNGTWWNSYDCPLTYSGLLSTNIQESQENAPLFHEKVSFECLAQLNRVWATIWQFEWRMGRQFSQLFHRLRYNGHVKGKLLWFNGHNLAISWSDCWNAVGEWTNAAVATSCTG